MEETPPYNSTDKDKPQEPSSPVVDIPQTSRALGDISDSLKAPFLPHVNPDAISYEQVHTGVCVHIPGSAKMLFGDELVFYWGVNSSSTPILLKHVNSNSVVRVLCVSYHFIGCVQYGLVDLYVEVYRDQHLIGTSPALVVTVNRNSPVTPRQRQRKRNMIRRYSKKPDKNRF
jgi:hypothetical protein